MDRIDRPRSEQSAGADKEAMARLADLSNTIDIAHGEETRKRPTDYLERLKSIQRRPPALPLVSPTTTDNDPVNTVVAPELSRLSETEISEFEFAVAELAWRLEGPIAASTDPELLKGHELLSETARMFEHLHLLQTGSET